MVGALALGDVERMAGQALHPLAENAGHEHRVVTDVPAHRHFVLGPERRRVLLPGRLDLEEHLDDGLQTGQGDARGKEILGAGEAREEIGEIRRRRLVLDGEIVERRSHRPIEEASQLHELPPSSAEASRLDHSRSCRRHRRPVC